MDKVIILGTYGFVGYSICMKLLEEGLEVEGYRLDQGESEEFIESKKLMIGRNSNFKECLLEEDFLSMEPKQDLVILISYYDLFHTVSEKELVNHPFLKLNIEQSLRKLPNVKIVCLFPNEFMNSIPSPFQKQILSLEKEHVPFQSIFLPTIYGPWQPETFLFQQYFLKIGHVDNLQIDERECTTDALYIDDVVESLITFIISKETSNIVLQNEDPNMWLKCAEYLTLQSFYRFDPKNSILNQEDCQVVKVKGSISYKEALEHQKSQSKLIASLY